MAKNNAALYDPTMLLQAGIDPKTGLPKKITDTVCSKESIRKSLRILDEQDAVNRYKWFNIPCNLSSQEVERMLYYRGQLVFFYIPALEQFYFMPFALDGTIDFYGRYNTVHPIPFAFGKTGDPEDLEYKTQAAILSQIKLDILYGIPDDLEKWAKKFLDGTCGIILHDYTRQYSQDLIPRQSIMDPILDVMSDCIPFMRTSLLTNTGIKGMRVSNQSDYPNVLDANRAFEKAALTGEPYVPIVGMADFQDLTGNAALKAEEFLLAMQGLDNYRLSLYGLGTGGLFQKRSHMLEAEQEMNAGKASLALQDGINIRQYFCDVVNSISGLGMSCEISETVLAVDLNLDGKASDDQDQSGLMEGEQDESI